jgi:outer membrane biosynthesis protein TonB
MFKRILLTGALFAAGAVSAQEVAISGKDFLSGAGDAKIAELARQAAASGKTLVITAPPYWQDKAAAKAHSAAANASVRTSDAFFENVMVRVEDSKAAAKPAPVEVAPKPAPPARPEAKPEAKPEPRPAPPVRKPVVEEAPAPAPKPVPVETPPPPPAVQAKPEAPVAAPAPAPVAAPPAAPPTAAQPAAPAAKPAADASAAIKKRLEQNLNAGQPSEGTLEVAQLEKDDLVYVSGSVRAVVRRFGPRTQLFWLDGELNLERAELIPTGTDRYRVSEPIRNVPNPSLRGGGAKATALKFVGKVPAAKSPARTALERQYNDGRDISGTLQAVDLHSGDLIYTAEGAAVVIRRTSVGMERYWLTGEIDLHQTGLQQQGNAVRVLTDNVK